MRAGINRQRKRAAIIIKCGPKSYEFINGGGGGGGGGTCPEYPSPGSAAEYLHLLYRLLSHEPVLRSVLRSAGLPKASPPQAGPSGLTSRPDPNLKGRVSGRNTPLIRCM